MPVRQLPPPAARSRCRSRSTARPQTSRAAAPARAPRARLQPAGAAPARSRTAGAGSVAAVIAPLPHRWPRQYRRLAATGRTPEAAPRGARARQQQDPGRACGGLTMEFARTPRAGRRAAAGSGSSSPAAAGSAGTPRAGRARDEGRQVTVGAWRALGEVDVLAHRRHHVVIAATANATSAATVSTAAAQPAQPAAHVGDQPRRHGGGAEQGEHRAGHGQVAREQRLAPSPGRGTRPRRPRRSRREAAPRRRSQRSAAAAATKPDERGDDLQELDAVLGRESDRAVDPLRPPDPGGGAMGPDERVQRIAGGDQVEQPPQRRAR